MASFSVVSLNRLPWNELAISEIDKFDRNYISKFPHIYDCFSQKTRTHLETKSANFSAKYRATFVPLIRLNEWLLQDEFQKSGALKSYAIFLLKLPLRAIRNIVQLPVTIVKVIVYAITHPAKACIKLITALIYLLHALTQPETWSKIGVGILGATLGQAVVGNPLAPIGLIVGSALLGAGLCGGALMKDKKIIDDLYPRLSLHRSRFSAHSRIDNALSGGRKILNTLFSFFRVPSLLIGSSCSRGRHRSNGRSPLLKLI